MPQAIEAPPPSPTFPHLLPDAEALPLSIDTYVSAGGRGEAGEGSFIYVGDAEVAFVTAAATVSPTDSLATCMIDDQALVS